MYCKLYNIDTDQYHFSIIYHYSFSYLFIFCSFLHFKSVYNFGFQSNFGKHFSNWFIVLFYVLLTTSI